MDGYEAIKKIRALAPDIKNPVINAVTAVSLEIKRKTVLSTGGTDILIKPFKENEIIEMLQKHLNIVFHYAKGEIPADRLENGSMSSILSESNTLSKETVSKLKKPVEALQIDVILNVIEEIKVYNQPLAEA